MKYPVVTTSNHQGKFLTVDSDQEIILIHDASGVLLGGIPWGHVIDRLLASDDDIRFEHCRTHPRAPLALKVRYPLQKESSLIVSPAGSAEAASSSKAAHR